MSVLSRLMKVDGYCIGGSDCCRSVMTEKLKKLGIDVFYKSNIQAIKNAKHIVVSSAIPSDNEELCLAYQLNKPIFSRGEFLGKIAKKYQNVIAVSGAHGKTTTTALIAEIFYKAGLNPTVHIGGVMKMCKDNMIEGGKDFFITEACEYKDNFLYLKPTYSVVLNIEAEHLDYFKTFSNVKKSFQKFVDNSQNFVAKQGLFKNGFKIGKDYDYSEFYEDLTGISFNCLKNNETYLKIQSTLHGRHNVDNILSAIAVAGHFGISKDIIETSIKDFQGVERRFEHHEFYNRSTLIFDYAHHPTEIKCVIQTVRQLCKGKLIVLFQPHTYSRTIKLFPEFLKCFKGADRIVIFKTYSAREKFNKQGCAKNLYNQLKKIYECKYSQNFNILKSLKNEVKEGDCVLVLGAGDFYDKCRF